MFIKALIIAGAAGLIAGAAHAQVSAQTNGQFIVRDGVLSGAQSSTTVNPAPRTFTEGRFSEDTALSAPALGTDVVAISADQARAQGIPVELVASAPVPDTPANRAKYGAPMSNAGKNTAAKGN